MKKGSRVFILSIFLLLLMLALSACLGEDRQRTPISFTEWGRAAMIGEQGDTEPSTLAVAPDGSLAAIASPIRVTATKDFLLHLTVLGADGEQLFNADLPYRSEDLSHIQFVEDDREFRLYFRDGDALMRNTWPMDPATDWEAGFAPEEVLRREGLLGYKAAPTPDGEDLFLLWERYSLDLAGPVPANWQEVTFDPELMMTVLHADMQVDQQGVVYVGYSFEESPIRVYVDSFVMAPDQPERLAGRRTPITFLESLGRSEFRGPIVSLEEGEWYLSYFTEIPTPRGLRDTLFFQAFPREYDALAEVFATHDKYPSTIVSLPIFYPPEQVDADISGDVTIERYSLPSESRNNGANLFGTPNTIQGEHDIVVLGTTAMLYTNTKTDYQPILVFLQDGATLGYQVLTWTDPVTLAARPARDGEGNMYAVWGEASGAIRHYPLYFATTNERMAAPYQQVTVEDTGQIATETLDRVLQSISMGFITMTWLAFPFIIAIIGSFYFESGYYYRFFSGLAFAVHLASKFWMTRELLEFIPGIAYVQPPLATILVYATPVLTMLLSFGIWWLFWGRKKTYNLLAIWIYLPVGLIDWVIGTIFYSIGYFS